MSQLYKIEHFKICGLFVAAVRASKNNDIMQTWIASAEDKRMVRDGDLIGDVEQDSRVRPISAEAFNAFCDQNKIDSEIPSHAIKCSLMLRGMLPTNENLHGNNFQPKMA